MRKRENAGVKGEYFRRKANLKRICYFLAWKTRNFSGKSDIFSRSNRKFLGLHGLTTPIDLKRIDAAEKVMMMMMMMMIVMMMTMMMRRR